MSVASSAVRFAVLLLPKDLRDRHREQWASDLRDAAEAGIAHHEIATGALAFAATVARPLPFSGRPLPSPIEVERRSRLAAGLALSAAVLGVSQAANIFEILPPVIGVGLAGLAATADSFILAFTLLATVVSVLIVTLTRAVAARVRLAVWLLALPACASFAQSASAYAAMELGWMLVTVATPAYLVGAAVVVVALRLLWTGLEHPAESLRLRSLIFAVLAVFTVGGLGLAQAAFAWANRTPIVFSWLPGIAGTNGPDGTWVQWEIPATQADYVEWLAMKNLFESMVDSAFTAWVVAVVVLAVLVVVLALSLRIRPSALAAVAIATLLIANSAFVAFLGWTAATPIVPTALLLTLGRLLLVAVILRSVGGLRLDEMHLPRVRHRHDVEGGVELLKG